MIMSFRIIHAKESSFQISRCYCRILLDIEWDNTFVLPVTLRVMGSANQFNLMYSVSLSFAINHVCSCMLPSLCYWNKHGEMWNVMKLHPSAETPTTSFKIPNVLKWKRKNLFVEGRNSGLEGQNSYEKTRI